MLAWFSCSLQSLCSGYYYTIINDIIIDYYKSPIQFNYNFIIQSDQQNVRLSNNLMKSQIIEQIFIELWFVSCYHYSLDIYMGS